MKAILKFDLPEEEDNFWLATNSSKLYSALWDVKQKAREYWKYQEFESEEANEFMDKFYGEICDIIGDLLDHVR